jgi:hypothetical protein
MTDIEHRKPDAEPSEQLDRLEQLAQQTEYLLTQVATGAHPRRNRGVDRQVQQLLSLQYRVAAATGVRVDLADTEAQYFSQNGEDGILQYLLALVGTTARRRSVELCAAEGIECNTANLIVNHGFHGLLVDGGDELLHVGRHFYEIGRDTWFSPPVLAQRWVTAENVNEIVTSAGFSGEIDVLSLDMDGVDWWIWRGLEAANPRIIVAEYNPALGPDLTLTVPYRPDFRIHDGEGEADRFYFGASLRAFVILARARGYRYVGSQRYGFNAFFVRDDLAGDLIPEGDIARPFDHPMVHLGMTGFAPHIHRYEWVDVTEVTVAT